MKFSNGAWTMAPGVRPIYPMRIESVVREPRKLVVRALSTADPSRGASIGGNAFTITLWSPVEGVIGVRVQHHRGARVKGPAFELADRQPDVSVDMDGSSTSFTSGGLTVTLGAAGKPWGLTFSDAEGLLTESPLKALGLMHKDDRRYLREMLTLEVGENVYGLGERFTPFVKNGQVVEIWHDDCGTCSDKAYKNIPFYLSNRGYGVLVNTPDRVVYECGTEHTTRVSFAVESEELEYFVIGGRDPKLVLQRLCELAGKPALPPAWSFGLWLSTSFTTAYDEKSVTAQIEGMRERNLPLHVFHFDCFWMKQSHWVDFTWDPDTFPDPRGMLERLKSRGLHICVWINPYVAELSSLFDEGLEGGYFLKRPNGDVYQRDEWQPNMALVDFTNSAARDWYKSKLRALVRMGVDSFKTDFGEVIPTDVVYHDGSDPERMHNYYTELYNKTVFELLEEELGKGAACVFARSATLGGQKYPVHWGGDCYATFPSMAETLRGGLSLSLASGSGATTSAGSSRRPIRRSTSAGLRSVCSRLTAASTAPGATGCRGPTTRNRWTYSAGSPSSSAGSCRISSDRPSWRTSRASRCCVRCCSSSRTIRPVPRSTGSTCSERACSSRPSSRSLAK
jgi:alpha-D-xyloside xylohydrolase